MKKKILAVCLAAAACVLLSTTIQTKSMQRNMAQEKHCVFHVLANSDSREDQALKLKVRDQVGTLMAEKFKGCRFPGGK